MLFAIFIVLIAGYFIQKGFQGVSEKEMLAQKSLVAFDSSQADIIEIQKPGKTFTISKKDSVWYVGKYPAIENQVKTLLDGVKDAVVVAMVSNTLDQAGEFGLGSEKAQTFTFRSGGKILGKITLGLKDPNSEMAYAIKEGDRKIYGIKNFSIANLDGEWISMLIDKTDKAEIQKIEIDENGRKMNVEKAGAEWTVNGRKANQAKVDDFLNFISTITAASLPEESEIFSNLDSKITITASSTEKILEFGKKDDTGSYYYVKNPQGLLFIVDKDTRDELFLKEWELK